MATIKDIISKYRGTQTGPQTTIGTEPGTIRRDVVLEAAEATKQQTLQAGAAAEQRQAQLESEQMKQQDIQRRGQMTQMQMSGREEKQSFELKSNQILNNLKNNLKQMSEADKRDSMEAASVYTRLMRAW